ncbi:MAG: branched-chain amino acid ABC transporter permease [Candidatus Komeilibacteria bacterium]|nr:branched-chain amino acid ABC transporter permease [Candidatus Komeilibacteria bacterium]
MFFWQILLNSLVIGTQVLLLAVPLYLVYSVSKIYHLGLGATAAATAYALYFGLTNDWPLGLSIGLAVIVALAVAGISYWLLEPFARQKNSLYGLLTSFALGLGLEALLAIMFGTDGKFLIRQVLPTFQWGDLYITQPGAWTIIVGVALTVLAVALVQKTPWGRTLRSVAENSFVASSLRINSSLVRLVVLMGASLLAGFVGIMTSLNTALTPQIGFNLVLMAFVALLVGGVSSLKGTVMAAYIVSLVPELLVGLSSGFWDMSANWKMLLVFIIATILLIWRPNGLLTKAQRAVD